MRWSLLFLGALVAFSGTAFAQEDVEFKHSAELRVRYQNDRNPTAVKDANDDDAGIFQRGKLTLAMRKGETLSGAFTLIHNALWGNRDESGGQPDSASGTPDNFGSENGLLVNRFWGWWKATDTLSFKFGRLGLELADGSVFAENDYEAVPTSHEGVLGTWDMDFAKLQFFGIKTDEFGLGTGYLSNDPEQNLYGFSLDFKNLPEALKMANFHFVQLVKNEVGNTGSNRKENSQRFGVTVGGDMSGFNYKLTAAYVTGQQKSDVAPATSFDVSESMLDVLVGYGLPDVMGLKVFGGYHMDSGDSDVGPTNKEIETYNPLFYDRHAYAGLMDVLEWGNLTYLNVGATANPIEDLEVGLGYYLFSSTKTGVNASGNTFGVNYSQLGLAADDATLKLSQDTTKDSLGSELDVWANKTYEGGFKIGARFGAFMPGDALENATVKHDQTIYQYWLQASLTF